MLIVEISWGAHLFNRLVPLSGGPVGRSLPTSIVCGTAEEVSSNWIRYQMLSDTTVKSSRKQKY